MPNDNLLVALDNQADKTDNKQHLSIQCPNMISLNSEDIELENTHSTESKIHDSNKLNNQSYIRPSTPDFSKNGYDPNKVYVLYEPIIQQYH